MPTEQQWLELHRVCLDTVRGVITGLEDEQLVAQPVPDCKSISSETNHLIGAEVYWLREVSIEPAFHEIEDGPCSGFALAAELDKIERQYQEILGAKGLDRDILFGLGRVCQHALYHCVGMRAIRKVIEPEWEVPGWPAVGSWERAVDFISDLLICPDNAKPGEG